MELIPNTVIYNRFLLKEQISENAVTGQRTWAVYDQESRQHLIAQFQRDGQVEWFIDNRTPPQPAPAAQAPVPPSAPVTDALPPQPTVSTGSTPQAAGHSAPSLQAPVRKSSEPSALRVLVLLLFMLVLGSFGYLFKDDILKMVGQKPAVTNQPKYSGDSLAARAAEASIDTTSPLAEKREDYGALSKDAALLLLANLAQQPESRHDAIFASAQKAFAGAAGAVRDSAYVLCAGRGAQTWFVHRMNGDKSSKKYAIQWYRTAYAARPSRELKDRIERLQNFKSSAKQPRKQNRVDGDEKIYFEKDPEIKS